MVAVWFAVTAGADRTPVELIVPRVVVQVDWEVTLVVDTLSSPWLELLGSGVQLGPKKVVPPRSVKSYLFPYQAAI